MSELRYAAHIEERKIRSIHTEKGGGREKMSRNATKKSQYISIFEHDTVDLRPISLNNMVEQCFSFVKRAR